MGKFPEMRSQHLFERKRQQLGKRRVTANDVPLKIDQGDPDRSILEGKVEQRQAGFRAVGRIRFRYHLSSREEHHGDRCVLGDDNQGGGQHCLSGRLHVRGILDVRHMRNYLGP